MATTKKTAAKKTTKVAAKKKPAKKVSGAKTKKGIMVVGCCPGLGNSSRR